MIKFFLLILVLINTSCKSEDSNTSKIETLKFTQVFENVALEKPVDFQNCGDDRIFVVEQEGRIQVINSQTQESNLFLDISEKVDDNGNEEGLLGLAFHPNFKNNGFFFVNYTATNPDRTVISRFSVANEISANPQSEFVILEIEQPYSNHNGGQIAFGKDGFLYIGMGDGGSAGDPKNHGQNLETLLGAMLRIDVDTTQNGENYGIPADNPFVGNSENFREEIFAYGLRNPWRFSFDSESGTLWAGDVGQNAIEEVDILENGKNYGWRIQEGTKCFNPSTNCDTTGLVQPIVEYTHEVGRSITGGFVYRGEKINSLKGAYVYADFVSGIIWSLKFDSGNLPIVTEVFQTEKYISTFGVDQNQELYFCDWENGKIFKFESK
ncbi:MAG: glucose sorbosone dehydrogenase [Calditrichaeota bacterium]|nr:MAG: glucose sorbosone dehydrogenase [Calditrichota bacterium]